MVTNRVEEILDEPFEQIVQRTQWHYRQGVDHAVTLDRGLLVNPPPQDTTLGHALNLLGSTAHRYRERLGLTAPLGRWSASSRRAG